MTLAATLTRYSKTSERKRQNVDPILDAIRISDDFLQIIRKLVCSRNSGRFRDAFDDTTTTLVEQLHYVYWHLMHC